METSAQVGRQADRLAHLGHRLARGCGRRFEALVFDQVERRTAVMERAAQMSESELLTSTAAEEAERDLLTVTG